MFRPVLKFALQSARYCNSHNASFVGSIRCFSDSVNSGTVKWFDSKKGFGFIVPDDGSEDIFVHQTAIHAEGFRSLAEGEPVEFSVIQDNSGKTKAENVTGPMGAYVQGAPRRPRVYTENNYGNFGGDGDMNGPDSGRGNF